MTDPPVPPRTAMRFGVYVPTFGEYDHDTLPALAAEAEAAGWDGFFVWDHLFWAPAGGAALADTTVVLTAIALRTTRIRFGALVTPLVRRRPWKLAKEAATLDRLSAGRLVLGAGLGAPMDTEPAGEGRPPREAAAVLDEGLEVLEALWAGEPVSHTGEHFRLDRALQLPTPLQRPRIPIWIAGFWPRRPPFRRAARWDGVLPLRAGHLIKELPLEEFRDCVAYLRGQRSAEPGERPFDIVAFAVEQGRDRRTVDAYERAGATWWVEAVDPLAETFGSFRERVVAGPPPH